MVDTDKLLNATVEKNPAEEAVEPQTKIEFGAELNDLRSRVLKGQDVTREELRAGLVTLRDTFGKKIEANKAAKKKPAKKKTAKKMDEAEAKNLLDNLI